MSRIILGSHYELGLRKVYEDRCVAGNVTSAAGLHLDYAIVADGVGGEELGETAAQSAIDAVVHTLENAREQSVPQLLMVAVQAANRAVLDEMRRLGVQHAESMSTTLAVAIILNGKTLYVANVGDSRVYLVRGKQLNLLTLDHTYGNLGSGRGGPDYPPGTLMRALGIRPDVEADVGFYVDTIDHEVATKRGMRGLPLKQGDSVLICSDGLIKESRTGTPFVKDQEIVQALSTHEGNRAAQVLVSFATGRSADDNVSVAVLQTPDPKRRERYQRRQAGVAAVIITLVLILGLIGLIALQTQGELDDVARTATRIAFVDTAIAETVAAAPTDTPLPPTATPTLRPSPQAGEIGAKFSSRSGQRLGIIMQGDAVDAQGEMIELGINHEPVSDGNDGNVYMQMGTALTVDVDIISDRISLLLVPGGRIFVESGRYRGGIEVRLQQAQSTSFEVSGSCMAMEYPNPADPSRLAVSCYEGHCQYSIQPGQPAQPLGVGQQIIVHVGEGRVLQNQPINSNEADVYRDLLMQTGAGRQDVLQCIESYASTPTPIPTNTLPPPPPPPLPPPPTASIAPLGQY